MSALMQRLLLYSEILEHYGPLEVVIEAVRRIYALGGFIGDDLIEKNITRDHVEISVGDREVRIEIRFFQMPDAGLFIGPQGLMIKRLMAGVSYGEGSFVPLLVHVLMTTFKNVPAYAGKMIKIEPRT